MHSCRGSELYDRDPTLKVIKDGLLLGVSMALSMAVSYLVCTTCRTASPSHSLLPPPPPIPQIMQSMLLVILLSHHSSASLPYTTLYGIDWDGNISCDDDTCRLAVPETVNPFRPIDYAELRAVIATANCRRHYPIINLRVIKQ